MTIKLPLQHKRELQPLSLWSSRSAVSSHLTTLPSENIHIGCQVGKVYRIVLREDHRVYALLVVLLEYVTQPKKKSRQGSKLQ